MAEESDDENEQHETYGDNYRPLLSVVEGKPLQGKLVQIESDLYGEGRESKVYMGTLKVGNRKIPVITKHPKQDRLHNDISHAEIDKIRRNLEAKGKLPMPYVYGKTPDGLLIQEYIPGLTLESKLDAEPSFLDDSRRLELVQMALDIGMAIHEETDGVYTLKGLSPDDILVAESSDEVKVKTEGKLICIDPSIAPSLGPHGIRESSNLENEANLFDHLFFANPTTNREGRFEYLYEFSFMGEELKVRTGSISAIMACFIVKPSDEQSPLKNRSDLIMVSREKSRDNFNTFCKRNNMADKKLIDFLYEIYHSDATKMYGRNDEDQKPKFGRKSELKDFKDYFDSL